MIAIRVIDLFGPVCVASEDGTRLRDLAHEALQRGASVTLDFSGITTLASAFLSPAIGGLYTLIGKDDLERRLLCTGLDATDEAMVQLVQRDALRFYSASPSQREALLSSSARRVEER